VFTWFCLRFCGISLYNSLLNWGRWINSRTLLLFNLGRSSCQFLTILCNLSLIFVFFIDSRLQCSMLFDFLWRFFDFFFSDFCWLNFIHKLLEIVSRSVCVSQSMWLLSVFWERLIESSLDYKYIWFSFLVLYGEVVELLYELFHGRVILKSKVCHWEIIPLPTHI
jgi:hypothetical protein